MTVNTPTTPATIATSVPTPRRDADHVAFEEAPREDRRQEMRLTRRPRAPGGSLWDPGLADPCLLDPVLQEPCHLGPRLTGPAARWRRREATS